MKSVMSSFARVPTANIPRASFDRSHGLKTTFNTDTLYPIFIDEALPGDTFRLRMYAFTRLNTPIHPIMDNVRLETFFFSVPLRQIWANFRKFMGEQVDPGDSIDYTVPTITSPASVGHAAFSIYDYLGIPPGVPDLEHSALPLRAIYHIWNEWFRNQNLQDSKDFDTDDGPDSPTDYGHIKRCKRHDYFTSALPWPQKGSTPVSIPLGTEAPIFGKNMDFDNVNDTGNRVNVIDDADDTLKAILHGSGGPSWLYGTTTASGTGQLMVDLETATAATINQLRQAFQIQKLLERDARGGTRYAEIVNSHFGVNFMDVTYRPEYLGGGSSLINVTPIAATAESGIRKVGDLAAMGTGHIDGHGFTKSFTEHCLLIGFVNIRADLTYQQGLNRLWSRSTRYDFYWPALAQIGEQSILLKEIYAQGTAADDTVFGYQERYGEYRYKPSMITAAMRSSYVSSLDAWHLSQDFASAPGLNDTFITEAVPMDRVVAVTTEPDFVFDAYFDMRCTRPMPLYGVPGMIDHF